MIHILREKVTDKQIEEMLEVYEDYIKLAVDIQRDLAAGGGEYHVDCEEVLIREGCSQENIWGSGWVPSTGEIRYEAYLNIQPRKNNPDMKILDKKVRDRVAEIITSLFPDR